MADIESINCTFETENALHHAYMPFIKGGGLFIRTKTPLMLNSRVNLTVQLLDESDTYTIEGKVIWITPLGAQGGKPTGMGIQFIGENRAVCNKIETYLAGMLKSIQPTDTM